MPARWKGLQLDYTTLQSFDTIVQIPVCLTQKQVAILKALLIPAYWQTRWTNLSITPDQLQAEMAELDYQLDGNECEACEMEFRDNPLDFCEVQYSNDGGETWQTMFRKDICAPPVPTSSINITNTYTYNSTVTTNHTIWDNDIINVAPEWEYEDPQSDRALCYAISKYVDWVCDWSIQQIETYNQEVRDANNWLDDVAVLISEMAMDIVILTRGEAIIPALVVGAIAWSSTQLVEYVWDYLVTVSADHYRDPVSRERIMCWMYNKLRGSTPQYVQWCASLDDFVPDGAEETAVATTVGLFNCEVDVFINYMILMEDINSVAELLPDCDCPQALIINQLAGPNGTEKYGTELTSPTDVSFANPGDTPSVAPGVWFDGSEYYWDRANPIGGVANNTRVVLPINTLVQRIRVQWGAARINETSAGDKNAAIWVGDPTTDGVYVAGHSWGAGFYDDQYITTDTGYHVDGLTATPRTHVYIHNSMDKPNGSAYVRWIYIQCVAYVP